MPRNPVDPRIPPESSPEADDPATASVAHTLLVRLWKEARARGQKPIWRGTISDLRGSPLGSFSSATELVGILADMAGVNVLLHVSCTELNHEPGGNASSPPD